MDLVVRAFPILAGQEESARDFAREILNRADEAVEFYGRFNVARETWHLQETPHGLGIICVTQILDRTVEEVGAEFAQSSKKFDRWFKDRVKTLSGIDPDLQPQGPPTECIFDTRSLSGA